MFNGFSGGNEHGHPELNSDACRFHYVLLRWHGWASQWTGSFIRLWTLTRASLWQRLDLMAVLRSCGTAGGSFRVLGQPQAAYLPGFG